MQRRSGGVRRLAVAVAVAGAGCSGVVLGASAAQAQAPACGAVVTSDVTLTEDVLGCLGTGLVVGADEITIDLGGHTLGGAVVSGGAPDQVGIDNGGGFDDVVIRNGTVREFAGAVHLDGSDDSRLSGLHTVLSSDYGILVEHGSRNRITGNTLEDPGDIGIGLSGTGGASRDNVIRGNRVESANSAGIALRHGAVSGTLVAGNDVVQTFLADGWGAGIAVGARYTSGEGDLRSTIVRGNRIRDGFSGGVFVADSARGTLVEGNAVDNQIGLPAYESDGDGTVLRANAATNSRFPGAGNYGVTVDARARDNRVEGNTIHEAGSISIDDSGRRTLVRANRVTGLRFDSQTPTGFNGGIVVREAARGGRVEANVVRRLAVTGGISPGAGIQVSGDGIAVVGNVVSEIDFTDGIRVEPEAAGTLVRANVADRAEDDGIDVAGPDTTVTANLATNNGHHGIEAVAGVRDGGGNRASGNGATPQCVGVTCSPA